MISSGPSAVLLMLSGHPHLLCRAVGAHFVAISRVGAGQRSWSLSRRPDSLLCNVSSSALHREDTLARTELLQVATDAVLACRKRTACCHEWSDKPDLH